MNAITTTLPQTVALALVTLSIIAIVVMLVSQLFLRRDSRQLFVSELPLPNIFMGWLLLWMTSAVLLWSYPFPTAHGMNPVRAIPPGMKPAARPELAAGAEEGAGVADNPGAELLVNNGCGGCHLLQGVEGMVGLVGPELSAIGSVALERLEDSTYSGAATSAEEYIQESILKPEIYAVPDYPAGVMPATFTDSLSPDDLQTIVEFLSTP
jgi:mono/diheme cytochrome c family protein